MMVRPLTYNLRRVASLLAAVILADLMMAVQVVGHESRLLNETSQQASSSCRICTFPGSTLRQDNDKVTTATMIVQMPPEISSQFDTSIMNKTKTCLDWQTDYVATWSSDSNECFEWQNWLLKVCCEGLPIWYQSQESVLQHLFSASSVLAYNPMVAPQTEWNHPVKVAIATTISALSIQNPGVEGGSIGVEGSMELSWLDQRLQWNVSMFGRTAIEVMVVSSPTNNNLQESQQQIWVPFLATKDVAAGSSDHASSYFFPSTSTAMVFANGMVKWVVPLRKELHCTDVSLGPIKLCHASLLYTDQSC